MNKSETLLTIFSTLILISSCQKNIEFENKDKELAGTPLPGQSVYCRIESFWENPFAIDQRFMLVLYDEYENPVAITVPLIITGAPYRTFKYDEWHRLKEYKGGYSYAAYEFWHFYGYDLNGRIGVDTLLNLGNSTTNYNNRVITQVWYDEQNRVSRTQSFLSPGGFLWEQVYSYDASGNLIRPGITYDNKTNLNRANDIWMFLAKDYSINNPFVAEEYNSAGYPTKINLDIQVHFIDASIFVNHSQISYGCRQAYW